MYKTVKNIPLNGAIISIKEGKSYYYLADNTYNIYVLNKKSFEIAEAINISNNYKPLHKFSKAIGISKNGLFNIAVVNKSKSILLSYQSGLKEQKTIDNHSKDIETSSFSDDERYLVTGGQDGKVYIHDMKYIKMVVALPNKPDYISCVKYVPNSDLIMASCYDKTTLIYNMQTGKYDVKLSSLPGVVEDSNMFDNKNKIHYICRDGSSVIYDIENKQIISQQKIFNVWPTVSIITKDEKYAIVGTREENLYAVDLATNKIVFDIMLEHLGVSTLIMNDNYLLIGYADGVLGVIDYKSSLSNLELYLKEKNYKQAKQQFDKNKFLLLHPIMQEFYDAWQDVIKKAIAMISQKQVVEAIEYVEPFTDDPQKAEEFKFYTAQIEDIVQLEEAIKQKKYVQAMILTDEKPFLKKLAIYGKIVHFWEIVFDRIKSLISDDPIANKQKIIDLLKQFKDVPSKKEIAISLMSNYEKILEAQEAAKEKRIRDFYKLCDKYQFIQETDVYSKVGSLGDRIYSQVVTSEQNGNYEKALNILDRLREFEPYQSKIPQLNKEIKGKQQFIQAIEAQNIKKAYSIAQRYPNVKYLKEFQNMNYDFEQKMEQSTKLAMNAKSEQIVELLEDYLHIPYTVDKAATVVKLSFLHEIERSGAVESTIDWHRTLNIFINLFGVDSELEYSCKKISMAYTEFMALTSEGNIDGYKKLNIPSSLLIYK
jgi:WD40 repeat protein